MGGSVLNKLKVLALDVLDSVVGAEQPKMYYDPQGKIKDVLERLPQLKKKYRPTPWLSNTHVHLLYFDSQCQLQIYRILFHQMLIHLKHNIL